MSFTITAKRSNPLAPFGIGEIIKGGFGSREDAESYVLDQWGEPGLGQVDIEQDDKSRQCECGGTMHHSSSMENPGQPAPFWQCERCGEIARLSK
jgi:hypothetical protein